MAVQLVGADDREVAVDKHVVRPVDGDHVHFVIAAAQEHHTVDGTSGIRGGRGRLRSVRRRSRNDRA